MATTKNASQKSKGKGESNGSSESNETGMQSSQLMQLFENSLKDIYWAEKALTKALPKMAKNASSAELVDALESHLAETEGQVKRLEEIFAILEKKPVAKKCDAMEGLIKEGQSIMEECEDGAMMDAGIIAASQKIEHYEIASYGTLRAFAETLGLEDAVDLLQQTLEEEETADEKLTEIAVNTINITASEEEEEEDEKDKGE